MDETWSVFHVGTDITMEVFQKNFLPEVYLKKEVHKHIRQSIRIVEKLMEYSYFEYQFYDMASLKIALTFEMALKIRYKEVNRLEWDKRKPLKKLIEWFDDNNYFEVYNEYYLKAIREVRNMLAHPSEHSFSGPHSRNFIENVLDLINGLYEDPVLRQQRMQTTSDIITQLYKFGDGIKCTVDNKFFYAFNAWPAFVNNKSTPSEVYMYFNPIFDFPEGYLESGNTWIHPAVFFFTGELTNISSTSIEIKTKEGQILIVSEIQGPDQKKILNDWKDEFESYCNPTVGYFFPGGKEIDTFSYHLRQFYKQ